MAGIKKLASQTLWYGLPTIASRFLGYIMNLSLPLFFAQPATTADLTQVYALIPFINVLFTYGLETAYFRYSKEEDAQKLYSTLSISLLGSTFMLAGLFYLLKDSITSWAKLDQYPQFTTYMLGIIFFDTLSTLAFAKLRQENKPKKYAAVRLSSIIINVLVVILFLGVLPGFLQTHPESGLASWYNPDIGVGYYLIGNLLGSLFTCILLFKEFTLIRFVFDYRLWKKVMHYSYPLIIVGMGGMINDMLSRLIYQHVVDLPVANAKHELGIFGNIFRLAVLITIMIQAFRMAAEPFFFNQRKEDNAQKVYARIMKYFVIACCFMFLFISLFIDVFGWFFGAINKPLWIEGLNIVPLLALGNVFLGIYYNLSIWYKLTNKNLYGAYITLGGALITIGLNIILIPTLHYLGAAIATFCCYLFMMIVSYYQGQKHFPVPYNVKKILAYLVTVLLLYGLHELLKLVSTHILYSIGTGFILMFAFIALVIWAEKKELQQMPFIGRFIR